MSEYAKSSAISLSAQNLYFAASPVVQQNGNDVRPPPMNQAVSGQHQTMRFPLAVNGEDGRKLMQKQREYEQQRSKLQHINAKNASTSASADALIAQMLTAQSNGFRSSQMHASSNANAFPRFVQPPTFNYHPHGFTPTSGNGAGVATPSAVQLTPKDLEKMMYRFASAHFDASRNYETTALPTGNGVHYDQRSTSAAAGSNMGNVFIIPTVPFVNADGRQFHAPAPFYAHDMSKPFPSWTLDKMKLPDAYTKYLHACVPPGCFDELPDTSLVYVLLRTSGLSNDVLGQIWAMVNRTQLGQLTKEEFYAALALVALAQETGALPTLDVLASIIKPPIPRLSLVPLNSVVPPPVPATPQIPSEQHAYSVRQPAPMNASVSAVRNGSVGDDFGEFTDFQAASNCPKPDPAISLPLQPKIISKSVIEESKFLVDTGRDKYDALRVLETPMNSINSTYVDSKPVFEKTQPKSIQDDNLDDGFGEFANAAVPISNTISMDRMVLQPLDSGLPACANTVVRSQTDPKIATALKLESIATGQKKDINELLRQNFENFDIGSSGGSSRGHSVKPDEENASEGLRGSKEPSVHSLDLQSVHVDFGFDRDPDTDSIRSLSNNSNIVNNGPIPLVDRYAVFREADNIDTEPTTAEKHTYVWSKCLEACLHLLKQASDTFSKASGTDVCREILESDRGSKYLSGNVQIYRVARRIRLSLKMQTFQTDKLFDMLTDIEMAWDNIRSLLAFSNLLPTPDDLDFRNAIIQTADADDENAKSYCGICLLNVDAACKTSQGTVFDYKLTYGGRQYHAQCANLWINCVDSILPTLDIPRLL